jgi:hypothetical protein
VILRNKRLDVAIKSITLLVLTISLLAPLRNLSYALSPNAPLEVGSIDEVVADGENADRYVAALAAPQRDRVLQYFRYGIRYYYFPVEGADGILYVRTMAPPRADASVRFAGRLQRFDDVAFAGPVRLAYEKAFGEPIPRQAWLILHGETPPTYQIVFYGYPPLILLWSMVLYLLVRGLQGKPLFRGSRRAA